MQRSFALGRRAFVAGAASLVGVDFDVRAQASGKASARIGYLHPLTTDFRNTTLAGLRSAWLQLGYADEMVARRAADNDLSRLPALVEELIDLGVSVLIVLGPAALKAASRVTKTIPIVAIDLETDPVRAGYVKQFSRPGGNVTGVFLDQASIAGKWVGLLREAAPDLRRVVVLWDPLSGPYQKDAALEVIRARGLDGVVLERAPTGNYDEILARLAGKLRTGVVHLAMAGFGRESCGFFSLAQRNGLPSITFLRTHLVYGGALLSYGPIEERYLARAMALTDRILKGAKASELALERPDHYEFVINQRVAEAMSLAISRPLLLRADEVIQQSERCHAQSVRGAP